MPQSLFVSYSHKDEDYKNYVISHLGVAEKQGLLRTWNDRRIKGGGYWREEIETALVESKIAILLISRHALTSDFILNEEVSTLLRRRDQEGLVTYPIVIRACDWDAVEWLKAMNLRPTDGKPLARFSLDRRDEVMAGISREIRGLLDGEVETAASPETLEPSPVDDEIDRLAQQAENLSAEIGTTRDALNGMFEILAEQNVPVEELEAKLREIAERHIELTKLWQALSKSSDDPEITSRRERATQALEDGDYDQAAELLEETRSVIRQARKKHQEVLALSLLDEASILSQQGDLEHARLNYRKAAEHFAEAASLVPRTKAGARIDYLIKQASALYDQGDEFGDNRALIEAIDLYQIVLKECRRDIVPDKWATVQNRLGTSLKALGTREAGTRRLKQAVEAYNAALEVRIRNSVPLDWATTQNNLGNALLTLGEREEGTERLEQAIEAYDAALQEWARDSVPLDWATTQNNRGNALLALGVREEGTERLVQAVEAYRAVLAGKTRDRFPLSWATTQNNLGNALQMLGDRTHCVDHLDAALLATRNAAAVYIDEAGQSTLSAYFQRTNIGD